MFGAACGGGATIPDHGDSPATAGAEPQSSGMASATVPVTSTSTGTPGGQVYYVAVDGPGASDANNGLSPAFQDGQNGPWLSIQHAAETMKAGDTTYVRAGVYHESGIVFAQSGAPGVPTGGPSGRSRTP